MQVTSIVCPRCRKCFTVKAPDLSVLQTKTFRCPNCGFSAPFTQLLGKPAGQASLHTHIAGGGETPGGKTRMAHGSIATVSLVIEETGRSFPIPQGSYTVGRESSDSRATLRLAPDPYMSRMHARLDVAAGQNGTACSITPMSSANKVYVNNRPLAEGERAELKDGDRVLLGMTSVRIKF